MIYEQDEGEKNFWIWVGDICCLKGREGGGWGQKGEEEDEEVEEEQS
jgi:hypothetical protein